MTDANISNIDERNEEHAFREDRRRRANQYLSFSRQYAVALAKMILAANEDPAPFHLRALPGVNADGQPTLWFRLYGGGNGPTATDGTTEDTPSSPPLNQSCPWPPFPPGTC